MPSRPFIKWFKNDWEAEERLSGVSLAAKGWWLHMIHKMYDANPIGYFLEPNGEAVNPSKFARRYGVTLAEGRRLTSELESHGVFSRDADGRIYCRRIVDEERRRARNQRNGQCGGNPMLLGITESDNQPGYPSGITESDKLRKLETRDSDSLRSSALEIRDWPNEVENLKSLAWNFVVVFANCRDHDKISRHLPAYTQFLAKCRSRGATVAEAWKACEDALIANNEKPLFASSVKTALDFLPNRASGRFTKHEDHEYQKLT
jgi:hypothetical protein